MTTSAPSKKSEAPVEHDPIAPVCILLSEIFSREIDEAMLGLLRLPNVADVIHRAAPEMESQLREDWNATRFESHAVEFCRLFVYPGVCVPRAENWAKDFDEEHFSVRRWFHDDASKPEFAAHIAELSDTHIAKILVLRAGLAGAPDELIEDYESQMIHPWLLAFAGSLESQSELPVYRAAAVILRALTK